MSPVAFGTDGIRGRALDELSCEIAWAIGRASAEVLGAERLVIGRDTRESGPLIAAALAAGAQSAGSAVHDLGVIPTPGVACICALESSPGAVVSASHNPWGDNGIKVLSAGGTKLTDAEEAAIERRLNELLDAGVTLSALDADRLLAADEGGADRYLDHLAGSVPAGALSGMRIVVDAAHGAASALAVRLLERLGAETSAIGVDPDGRNINDGVGSTHPEALAAAVLDAGADLGLALDGDADRLVAVDERGRSVPGDALLSLFAEDLAASGRLGGAIVITVMSNLGLKLRLAERSIEVVEVGVGDRNVLHALDEAGLVLGGEQSGHVIFRDRATTGDGMLTGILLAELVARRAVPLSALADGALDLLPQVLISVPVASTDIDGDSELRAAEAQLASRLGASGRILLRASGTEPLVRVMVEAADAEEAEQVAAELAALVAARLGNPEDDQAR